MYLNRDCVGAHYSFVYLYIQTVTSNWYDVKCSYTTINMCECEVWYAHVHVVNTLLCCISVEEYIVYAKYDA